ncbi:MAG: RNA methyltransferase [Candidatus Nezhaarchaeales archaeon]
MDLRVVLVEPEWPSNIGGVARVMKNFGFNKLYLVNPKLKKWQHDAKLYAAHGVDVIDEAQIVNNITEVLRGVNMVVGTTAKLAARPGNVTRVAIFPSELATKLSSFSGVVAIIFGRESIGLTNEELALCDIIVTIPANRAYPVLNIVNAAAIVLYEIYIHNMRLIGKVSYSPAPSIDVKNRLLRYFEEIVQKLDNMPIHKKKQAVRVFRSMMGRAFISRKEASVLVGTLRRVNLALNILSRSKTT